MVLNTQETFFTRLGCMDGRIQKVIATFGEQTFHALYPDSITGPGIVGVLGENPQDEVLFDIEQQLSVSVTNHKSRGIVVFGHQDCAGNPVDDMVHRQQVQKSIEVVYRLIHGAIGVIGVFVVKNENALLGWDVEVVGKKEPEDPVASQTMV